MKLPIRVRGAPAKALSQRKPSLRKRQDRPLTEAQRVFVGRFLIHHNATRAYREAFPEAMLSTAESEGSRLNADPRIAQEIKQHATEACALGVSGSSTVLMAVGSAIYTLTSVKRGNYKRALCSLIATPILAVAGTLCVNKAIPHAQAVEKKFKELKKN
jgi:hypothetical protein